MTEPISIHLKNDLSEIERVHTLLQTMEDERTLSAGAVFAITLSLDELLTNIISYGYSDRDEHTILVTFSMKDQVVETVIVDDGKAFNPLESQTPDLNVPLEQRKIGGLGIHLVRNFMDELEYKRVDEKNVLILRKNIEQE